MTSKRLLLLGSKVMTNLDSLLKSRDITFSTKVCLIKAMLFPVVMCGCESLTLKKAESQRTNAFFTVQFSHPYMTTGKTITLTVWTFVGKVMSLLFNKLSRFVISFLSRNKCVF